MNKEVQPKRELLYRLDPERVRRLFRWSGAKIFTIPTAESVRQFRRILEATQDMWRQCYQLIQRCTNVRITTRIR